MYYKIAETLEEKKAVVLYYESIRKEMEKMREEFDTIKETKYNNNIIKRIEKYNYEILLQDENNRSEFIESINSKLLIKKKN
jgi:hypothetical protein